MSKGMTGIEVDLLVYLTKLREKWQLSLMGNEIADKGTRERIEKTVDRVTDFLAEIEGDIDGV